MGLDAGRAAAARQAAEQATTGYARVVHRRVADVHTELAARNEDFARTLGAVDGEGAGEVTFLPSNGAAGRRAT